MSDEEWMLVVDVARRVLVILLLVSLALGGFSCRVHINSQPAAESRSSHE